MSDRNGNGTPETLKTWGALSAVSDEYKKDYKKSGSSYTSVNTTYNALIMTQHFGRLGQGWGYEVVERWVQEIPDLETGQVAELHACLRLRLWAGDRGQCWDALGQWKLAYVTSGQNSYLKINDEAWISAETRALSKGFSRLGLAADVYLDTEFSESDHEPTKRERPAAAPQEHPAVTIARRLFQAFARRCDQLNIAVDKDDLNKILEVLGVDKLDAASLRENENAVLEAIDRYGSAGQEATATAPDEGKAARLAALQGESEPESAKGDEAFNVLGYLHAQTKERYEVEGEKATNMLRNSLTAEYGRELSKLPATREAADALLERLEAILDGKQVSQ